MTAVSKTQQNGSKAPAAKKPTKPQVPSVLNKKELTIDERLDCANDLRALGDHRALLQEKRSKLKELAVKGDEIGLSLNITSDRGDTFNTTNPEVMKGVLESIDKIVSNKIDEIEVEILATTL